MGPSAALTPAIWDKTIPYDSETFHLEYMDLEEFLIENGISSTVDEGQQKKPVKESSQTTIENPCTSSTDKTTPAAPISLLTVMELDQCEEEVVTITASSTTEVTSGWQTEKSTLCTFVLNPQIITWDGMFVQRNMSHYLRFN